MKTIINKHISALAVILMSICCMTNANATHVIGGELSYRCVGNGQVEFTLIVRQDCELGALEAFHDDPAYISVFDWNNNLITRNITGSIQRGYFEMEYLGVDTLFETLDSDCELFNDPVCVTQAVYRRTLGIPMERNSDGYRFVYQRCCRNSSLTNVVDPLETGMSLVASLSNEQLARENRAPTLPAFPPIYACAGQPFNIPQGGTDPDGDILSYRLVTPNIGATDSMPWPVTASNPPYDPVTWAPGYNVTNMMLTTPGLTIDPNTGLIEVTPTVIGQFLVAFCVDETAPNGRVANTTCREFEVNVRACAGLPTVEMDDLPDTLCDNLTLMLDGTSDADNTVWIIDGQDPIMVNATNPATTVTFDTFGTYTIRLIGDNAGCEAADSMTITLLNSGLEGPDGFEVMVTDCDDDITISVSDTVTADPDNPITSITYTITEGGVEIFTTNDLNFTYTFDDNADVTICQVITTANGCDQNTCRDFSFELLELLFESEIDTCIGEEVDVNVSSTSGAPLMIMWEATPLITDIRNDGQDITVQPTDTTDTFITFTATDDNGCVRTDSFRLIANELLPELDFEVSTGGACDTLGIVITNTSIDSVEVIWNFGDGNTSNEWEPGHTYNNPGTYTITLSAVNTDCGDAAVSRTITIDRLDVRIDVTNVATGGNVFCEEAEGRLDAIVDGAQGQLTYEWSPLYNVIGATDAASLSINVDSSITYCVTVTDAATGCVDSACANIIFGGEVSANLVSPDGVICIGDTVKVAAVASGEDTDCNYDWNFAGTVVGPDDQDTLCFIATGNTSVVVTLGCADGCVATSDPLMIEVRDLNSIIRATVDPEMMERDGQQLQLDAENGEEDWTYQWEGPGLEQPDDIKSPTAVPGEIGIYTYTVSVVDNFGCEAVSSVSTSEPEDNPCEPPYVYVPNAFSPNGDGENETVTVRGRDIDEIISFIIYNRWGQEVYRVDNVGAGAASWDGQYEGELGHNAVFGYYLHVRCDDGQESIQQGNISLIR